MGTTARQSYYVIDVIGCSGRFFEQGCKFEQSLYAISFLSREHCRLTGTTIA